MISIKATDSASRIEISDEASARPIHSADVSQILSIISHAPLCACGTKPTRDRKRRDSATKNRPRSTDRILPFLVRGRSHQPLWAVSGDSIPIATKGSGGGGHGQPGAGLK